MSPSNSALGTKADGKRRYEEWKRRKREKRKKKEEERRGGKKREKHEEERRRREKMTGWGRGREKRMGKRKESSGDKHVLDNEMYWITTDNSVCSISHSLSRTR